MNARLRLRGRGVLVAGPAPAPVVAALLGEGADVRVAATEVAVSVQDLHERGLLRWLARPWAPRDLDGADLVVAVDPDPGLQEACRSRRRWYLTAADLDLGDAPARPAEGVRHLGLVPDEPSRPGEGRAGTGRTEAPTPAAGSAIDPAARPTGRGEVILVGGGPGDPELLTLGGVAALARADVVVHDRLAPLGVLPQVASGARWVDVGKIPRGRSTPQEAINALLVEHARRGQVVVRLKGGDPFVFGRGGEEAQACEAHGIPVRVVPGVSSSLAAPALAGVPVTHRGVSQGYTVLSGHLTPDDPGCTVDYAALARSGTTLVLLMAVARLPEICTALQDGGLPGDTPAVTVADAALPSQRVLRSTLAALPEAVAGAGLGAPAVTVVGAVAGIDLGLTAGRDQQAANPGGGSA